MIKENIEKIIEEKYEKLKQQGIIILKPMKKEKIEQILKTIEKHEDIAAFTIEEENKKSIVLRYIPIIKEFVDVEKLKKQGNNAYKKEDYNTCIKKYRKILQLYNNPETIVYAKLGLSYLKKGDKNTAIDYLTIATYKETEEIKYDFRELLMELKGEINPQDKKKKFEMKKKDFDFGSANNYYGIGNFSEINEYIITSKLDIETACQNLNMTLKQIDIIKLIYAREYYIQGDIKKEIHS